MKERPIIFSGEMVRAILDGRKSQTRRVVKLTEKQKNSVRNQNKEDWVREPKILTFCPYGVPGDRLWVRETWGIYSGGEDGDLILGTIPGASLVYRATDDMGNLKGWKPSIFMPRWASRITLEITDIRVERVQDISDNDCIAEGLDPKLRPGYGFKYVFGTLWGSMNGKKYPWESNPWVWVVSFKEVKDGV